MKHLEERKSGFNNLIRPEGISTVPQGTIPIYADSLGN